MKKTSVEFIDDVDGSEAVETMTFGLDGVSYEIDLSETNAAGLRETAGPWVDVARCTTAGRQRRGPDATTATHETQRIRAGAKDNGHDIADRGRIPEAIRAPYANFGS